MKAKRTTTEDPSSEVVVISNRIAEIQRRKTAINTNISRLRADLAAYELEASDLAKEHLIILRRFDSVATLP